MLGDEHGCLMFQMHPQFLAQLKTTRGKQLIHAQSGCRVGCSLKASQFVAGADREPACEEGLKSAAAKRLVS